jgi:hypothetical protein
MKIFLKKVWRYENELYLCVALRNKAANEPNRFQKSSKIKKIKTIFIKAWKCKNELYLCSR